MAKIELQRGHRIFLGIAGLVLLGSGAGAWYTWKDYGKLEEQHEAVQGQISAARAKIEQIDDFERDVIILRENLQEYVRILPSSSEVHEFYTDLNRYASDAGIVVTNLSPGTTDDSSTFARAEYKLSFSGTYHQVLKFVHLIESHERFTAISSLRLTGGSVEEDRPEDGARHAVNLTVETYVYGGATGGNQVDIPGYDRKKVQLSEQIQEARQDLDLDRFQLLADSTRRDPMVDPRARVTLESSDERNVLVAQRERLEEVDGLLEECASTLDLASSTDGNIIREMELSQEAVGLLGQIDAGLKDVQGLGEIADVPTRRQFDTAKVRANELRMRMGEPGLVRDDEQLRLRSIHSEVAEHFDQAEYQDVLDDCSLADGIRALDPESVRLRDEIDQYRLVAAAALDFGALDLAVSGLINNAEHDPERESVAVINGRVYREREFVSDELELLEIHRDFLRFDFRGVPLNYDF